MTSAPPDFLDRLVDKTFGQQAAIDPRLPSMFEPRAIGPAPEPEEPAAVTDAAVAPRDGRITNTGASTRSAQRGVAGDAPAGRGYSPAASARTVEPHGAIAAPDDGPWADLDIAAPPRDAGIAETLPTQIAVLRPDAAYRASAAAAHEGTIRISDAATPKRPAAAPGERGVGPVRAETSARAARDSGVPLQIEMMDRTLRAPQGAASEITVVRPTAEHGGTPPRAAAPRTSVSERHAPPREDAPVQQGALLPAVPPPQRAAFTSSAAPQRRNQKAPPHGEAHETPTIVNVTIGRVEVRAAGGTAPRGAEKREPGPLSLADYLKRRSER